MIKQEVPTNWTPYISHLSILTDAVHWESLRQWPLSDVWRVTMSSGKTVIVKLGMGTMAGELKIYRSVLEPMNLPCPILFEAYEDSGISAFVLEDLGRTTVEMNPKTIHFVNAARKLADLRKVVIRRIHSLKSHVYNEHLKHQEQFIRDIAFVIDNQNLYSKDELILLNKYMEKLPKLLAELYEHYLVTITHNDYNAKNLMIVNESIIPIDWSNAYFSPHLGDLYCLVQESKKYGIDESIVIDAYRELENNNDIERQINVGGICWLIHGLRWVCEEGIQKVPGTRSWISSMITAIGECFEQL